MFQSEKVGVAMFSRFCRILLIITLFTCFPTPFFQTEASVTKEVKIESVPSGAEVYLKRGRKEDHLGQTPLIHQINFHSNFSVIRMLFKKTAYHPLTLEVSAQQAKVEAKLEPISLTAAPDTHSVPRLKQLQSRINPILNRLLPELLEKCTIENIQIDSLYVVETKKAIVLILPVTTSLPKGQSGQLKEKHFRKVWNEIGSTFILPVAKALHTQEELFAILLEVHLADPKAIARLAPVPELKVEMECVEGYKTQEVLKTRRIPIYNWNNILEGYRTETYKELQQVWNPCLYKRPVLKPTITTKLKMPSTTKDRTIRYLLSLASYGADFLSDDLYDKLSILYCDHQGTCQKIQGTLEIPLSQWRQIVKCP